MANQKTLNKNMLNVSERLFSSAKVERVNAKGYGHFIDGKEDELLDLEGLSDWSNGVLCSRNFNEKISDKKNQEQMKCMNQTLIPKINNWAARICFKFPATASYAYSVLMQLSYINGEMIELNDLSNAAFHDENC